MKEEKCEAKQYLEQKQNIVRSRWLPLLRVYWSWDVWVDFHDLLQRLNNSNWVSQRKKPKTKESKIFKKYQY